MTTSPSTPSSTFTPEQRQILGQVYNLILGWRRVEPNLESGLSGAAEVPVDETAAPDPAHSGGSNG